MCVSEASVHSTHWTFLVDNGESGRAAGHCSHLLLMASWLFYDLPFSRAGVEGKSGNQQTDPLSLVGCRVDTLQSLFPA